VFAHVGLHAWAERHYGKTTRDVRGEMKSAGMGPAVIRAQVRRLRKVVLRLDWNAPETAWSDYSDRTHYTDADLAAKEDFVRRAAGQRRRAQVLDLGANDGRFTEAVMDSADYAIAADRDDAAVDVLYRRLRDRREHRILPLCIDLGDPTGSFGWRARERSAFFDRVRPDLVLFLAVIHHLVVTDSVPIDEVVAMLASLRAETVLEFPTPDDPMVQRLGSSKKDRKVARYDLATLDAALTRHALDVVEQTTLPSGTRVLYQLRPRA
jgi:hypothetical protein